MIKVKIKRQTKDKMDKHLQSHSPAHLSTKKYHTFFLIWQFYFLGSTLFSYLVDFPISDCFDLNLGLGGAKHLHSTLKPSEQRPKFLKHHSILV